MSLSFVSDQARLTYQRILTSPSSYVRTLSNGKGASLSGTKRCPMTPVVFHSVNKSDSMTNRCASDEKEIIL
ncbi:hypothetical protein PCAR4_570171 [Paraburkholderia caribensis]|nr:hypothetical protein PCAR4_570171 [Paraburkholderia caribensis]